MIIISLFQYTIIGGYLAALSLSRKNLNVFETTLNNLADVPKAEYVKYVSQISSEEAKQAELALLLGKPAESERILLQVGNMYIGRYIDAIYSVLYIFEVSF